MEAVLETRRADKDDGQAMRAAIGVIVLQTDETIEHDLRAMMPADGVRLYHNRIPMANAVTADTLAAMKRDLPASVAGLPGHVAFSALGYGCTSASMVIGEAVVGEVIHGAMPGVPVSNPFSALKAALRALGVDRLGIVSPYSHEISTRLRDALDGGGVSVTRICSFGEGDDRAVARIAPASVLEAMVEVGGDANCNAVFASCTNLRAADVLAEVEARTGKPALCSNQVLAWHLMRLARLDDAPVGYGRLFAEPLS